MTARRAILAVAVGLLALIPYLSGISNGFAFDDVAIAAENPRIRSIAGVRDVWTTDWWGGTASRTRVYRPLAMLTFSLDYAVARRGATEPPPVRLPDRSAAPFHAQNLLWHAGASIALFLLVIEMFASPALAFVTGALFAVHPVHTEAVYGIVGRAELVSAVFVFSSLIVAWQVFRDDTDGLGRPMLAGGLLTLAALSKEYAVVVPAVPVIWLFLRPRAERRAIAARRSFRLLVGSLAAGVLIYLVLRGTVLGTVTGVAAEPGNVHDPNNPIATASGAARWLTPIRVFGEVLRLLVFPRTLSVDYSFAQIPVVPSPDLATVLSFLALAGIAAAAVVLRKRAPAASFGILFFFLTWALTSNFIVPIGTILGERLLYLPSAGACLAVACGLVAAGRRFRWPALVVTTAIVLLGASRTWARAADWRDDLTLFTSAARACPRSCKVLYNLAIDLQHAGRTREAMERLEQALQLGPNDAKLHNNLAGILRDEGRLDEAIAHLEQAVRIDPGNAESEFNLGGLLRQTDRIDEAVLHLRRSAVIKPADAATQHALGEVLEKSGASDEAIEHYRMALSLDPNLAEAHNDLGVALARTGRIPEALEEFRAAVRLKPDFESARTNLRQAERIAGPHP